MRNKMVAIPAFLFLLAITVAVVACEPTNDDAVVSQATQQSVMSRANAAVPAYQPSTFPARETINRYLMEIERPGEWYGYFLNIHGEVIYYMVSDFKPQNICVSLTSPDRLAGQYRDSSVITSPALDGVYYGGANCNAYYMFDATTGGMIELAGDNYTLITSRVPLFLETDAMRIIPMEGELREK